MKYLIVTLTAAALCTGCIRPPEEEPGGHSERFKIEFSYVRSVTSDDVQIMIYPPPPRNPNAPVRIEGPGVVETPWASWTGDRYGFVPQRGHVSLSYAAANDTRCTEIAEQAQREGRSLLVEGFGSVAQAAIAQYCGSIPTQGGGGTGGSNSGAEATSYYACPQPAPLPVEPNGGTGGTTEPARPYPCGCEPSLPSIYVRAEKIASCSLGGRVTQPPTTEPSPLPPVEPQPGPTPNSN